MAKNIKTGGRRKGVPNKKTVARQTMLASAATGFRIQSVVEEGYGSATQQASDRPLDWHRGDAHALLKLVYSDPRYPMELRIDAAKSAVRFERPALLASHVQHSNAPTKEVISRLTTEQIRELLAGMDSEKVIDGQSITLDGAGDC